MVRNVSKRSMHTDDRLVEVGRKVWVGRHSVVHLSPPLSPPLGCPRGHLYTNVPLACTLLASSISVTPDCTNNGSEQSDF